MATVKQVLAAISQDGTLGPNQKSFVTEAIKKAELWINLQTAAAKPRRITNAKNLMTLFAWEEKYGVILLRDVDDWIAQKGLSRDLVYPMLAEFKEDMVAKGKQYADFKAAFKIYLTKGYLSKKLEDCKRREHTTVETRGISL